jgi:hypothetical protein
MPRTAAPGLRPPIQACPPVPALTLLGTLTTDVSALVVVTRVVNVTVDVTVTGGEALGAGETTTVVGEGLVAANRVPFVGVGSDWFRVDCARAAAAMRAPRKTTTAPPMVRR